MLLYLIAARTVSKSIRATYIMFFRRVPDGPLENVQKLSNAHLGRSTPGPWKMSQIEVAFGTHQHVGARRTKKKPACLPRTNQHCLFIILRGSAHCRRPRRIPGFSDFSTFREMSNFGFLLLGFRDWEGLQWIGNGCGLQMDGFSAHFDKYESIFDYFHDFVILLSFPMV